MENDMSYRIIALGVAALVAASPIQAQRRGTVELGAFGGATARVRRDIALSAQVYAVPADVTTIRVAAQYSLR